MPERAHPPHPSLDIDCARCAYWLIHKAEKVAIIPQPNGQIAGMPYNEAYQKAQDAGQIAQFLANVEYQTVSECAWGPMWSKVTANHWCAQFVSRRKS